MGITLVCLGGLNLALCLKLGIKAGFWNYLLIFSGIAMAGAGVFRKRGATDEAGE
ncbi:MAG: hypothetical protein WA162_05405 [Thermodesulfobacteriota bacterium]